MGKFRDMFNEARNSTVPTEYRIAFGQLKRMYNPGEVPSKKELEKDAKEVSKKNHIEEDKFLEFAMKQFKINESDDVSEAKMETAGFDKIINLLNTKRTEQAKKEYMGLSKTDKELFNIYLSRSKVDIAKDVKKMLGLNESKKEYDKDATPEDKANAIMSRCKKFRTDSDIGYLLNDADIINGIKDATKWGWKESEKFFKDNYKKIKMNESAVGTPGRTTVKDAEEHIDDELVAEFRKIIKKLGGKTVAKVLLDKLGQKTEIKDEIEHIEDIIDNSNY